VKYIVQYPLTPYVGSEPTGLVGFLEYIYRVKPTGELYGLVLDLSTNMYSLLHFEIEGVPCTGLMPYAWHKIPVMSCSRVIKIYNYVQLMHIDGTLHPSVALAKGFEAFPVLFGGG